MEIKAQSEAAEKAQKTWESNTNEETNDSRSRQPDDNKVEAPAAHGATDSEDSVDTEEKSASGVLRSSGKLPSSHSSSQQGSRAPSRRSSFEGREDKAGDMSEVDFSMLDNPLDTDIEPGLQVKYHFINRSDIYY